MKRHRMNPLFLAVATCLASALPSHAQRTVAFTGATVWDGTGGPAQVADILVVDGRIVEVGDPSIPTHATVFDYSGKWIIPGLVEAHAHVSGYWAPDHVSDPMGRIVEELGLYAGYGVTTVNSLGDEPLAVRQVRDSQGTQFLEHARVAFAGPVITAVTPEEATAAVAENAAAGVDWMKIRVDDNLGTTAKMPWETVQAVLDATHERGLRLATHLFYLDDAKRLLRMGTDLVAHSIRDAEVDDEVIGLLKETGTCYVPTLTREVSAFVYGDRPEFFDDPFFQESAKESEIDRVSEPAFMESVRGSTAAGRYREGLGQAQRNLNRLSDAGIPIAFGTDAGPAGRFPGYFEHMELELMVEAGLTPEQALASATRVAASCLDMPDVGTLEDGNWADLLVLGSSPLEDITATKTLVKVFIAGNEVR
ncbi:amidohydrolase family protein [Gemmatimonadota bacterium]